ASRPAEEAAFHLQFLSRPVISIRVGASLPRRTRPADTFPPELAVMRLRFPLLVLSGLLAFAWITGTGPQPSRPPVAHGAEPAPEVAFGKEGIAFLSKHCIACHGPEKKKADLVLHVYKDEQALLRDRKTWFKVLRVLGQGEMPPPARPRPTVEESEHFIR